MHKRLRKAAVTDNKQTHVQKGVSTLTTNKMPQGHSCPDVLSAGVKNRAAAGLQDPSRTQSHNGAALKREKRSPRLLIAIATQI